MIIASGDMLHSILIKVLNYEAYYIIMIIIIYYIHIDNYHFKIFLSQKYASQERT